MGGPPMGGPPMGGAPMGAAPAAGGSNTMRYLGIGCGVLFLISCLCSAGWYACNMMAAGAITAAGTAAPVDGPGGGGGGGGGSVCQRAVDCCNAYAATPYGASVASSCPSYNTAGMPDAACQSAIDGFRSGLTATGQTVPPACQ